MVRWVVTNDGIPFRQQDWQRLKKIAEGNPDEEKIGAFGVGFYSLWSVCGESQGKAIGLADATAFVTCTTHTPDHLPFTHTALSSISITATR
jgi:hypothetical protein